jgi:hypothetical protein
MPPMWLTKSVFELVRHDAMQAQLDHNPSSATSAPTSKQPLLRSREASTELER